MVSKAEKKEDNIKYLIRINYKSGIQEEFWVKNIEVKINSQGDITDAEWTIFIDKDNILDVYRPIVMCVNNIESVWQLAAVEIK